jgi:hypothetical protein
VGKKSEGRKGAKFSTLGKILRPRETPTREGLLNERKITQIKVERKYSAPLLYRY